MAISIAEPIIIPEKPAVPSQIADAIWVPLINIQAPTTTGPVNVRIQVTPYVSQTGELVKSQTKSIIIPDLYAAAMNNPALAQAVYTIYAAIQTLVDERELYGKRVGPPENPVNDPPA